MLAFFTSKFGALFLHDLVELAFEEMAHAIFVELGSNLGAQVFLTLDIEQAADIGDFISEEGEGVFLLLVNLGIGGTFNALSVSLIVNTEGVVATAINRTPCDLQRTVTG